MFIELECMKQGDKYYIMRHREYHKYYSYLNLRMGFLSYSSNRQDWLNILDESGKFSELEKIDDVYSGIAFNSYAQAINFISKYTTIHMIQTTKDNNMSVELEPYLSENVYYVILKGTNGMLKLNWSIVLMAIYGSYEKGTQNIENLSRKRKNLKKIIRFNTLREAEKFIDKYNALCVMEILNKNTEDKNV